MTQPGSGGSGSSPRSSPGSAEERGPDGGPGISRFDGRVEDYAAHRPTYPAELLTLLTGPAGLPAPARLVDVGAGTGRLAERLLDGGHEVTLVEPHAGMRAAAERALGGRPGVRVVAGRAEATGLPDGCADGVLAAQAFHWFEPEATRHEFARLLRPGGQVVLLWNERDGDACPLLADYERLVRSHVSDLPRKERDETGPERVRSFFGADPAAGPGAGGPHELVLDNTHRLDWAGFSGRALSTSYVPRDGPEHGPLMDALRQAFERHADADGTAELVYRTVVYFGRLG